MDCDDTWDTAIVLVLVLWARYWRSVSVRKWSIPKGRVLVLGDDRFQEDWVQKKEIEEGDFERKMKSRPYEVFVIMSDPSHSVSVRKWLISREIVLVLVNDRVQRDSVSVRRWLVPKERDWNQDGFKKSRSNEDFVSMSDSKQTSSSLRWIVMTPEIPP